MTPKNSLQPAPDISNGNQDDPVASSPRSRLLRNSILNFAGQVLPLGFALVAVPFIIKGFGVERFGLLSLAWLLLGYFAFFDLGLGRATVRFVAESIHSAALDKIPGVVWTSVGINLGAGLLGGLGLWLTAPYLAQHVFTIPPALVEDVRQMFAILAFSVPAITTGASVRGVLEAGQRFDIVNAVKAPSNILIFLIPMLGVPPQLSLAAIVGWMVLSRYVTTFIYLFYAVREFPVLAKRFAVSMKQIKPLLSYGGWVSLSNFLTPVIAYAERFLIAAMLPIGMLAYYTAPFEMISRLGIIPYSISLALFPAFSQAGAQETSALRERLVLRPFKYLLLVLTPLAAFFVFFAPEILHLWLGESFRTQSSLILQILAIAFFFNALAYIPLTAVQGLGRPELKAKLDLIQALLFAVICWGLIRRWELAGAAVAKVAVFAADTVCLFWFTRKILKSSLGEFFPKALRLRCLLSLIFLSVGFFLKNDGQSLGLRLGIFFGLLGVYLALMRTKIFIS